MTKKQRGAPVAPHILFLLFLVALMFVGSFGFVGQVFSFPDISAREKICTSKAEFASAIMRNRGTEGWSEEEILEHINSRWLSVEKDNRDPWHIPLDMQRMTRDAFRQDSKGNYKRNDAEKFANNEFGTCLSQGF